MSVLPQQLQHPMTLGMMTASPAPTGAPNYGGGGGGSNPSPGVKLFVGSLPRDWSAEQVRQLFTQFGTVLDVLVFSDRNTGDSKGASFVTMASNPEADAAIIGLHKKQTLPNVKRPLQVCHAHQDVAKLFVGSLPPAVTEMELSRLFTPFGQLVEMYLMKNSSKPKAARSAFLHFLDRNQAQAALSLNGAKPWPTCTRPIVVRFAYSAKEKQQKFASRTHQRDVIRNATALSGSLFAPSSQPVNTLGGMAVALPTPEQQQVLQSVAAVTLMQQQDQQSRLSQVPQQQISTNPVPPVAATSQQSPPIQYGGGGSAALNASLYIYNLPYWFTEHQLYSLFSPFGQLSACQLFADQNNSSNGESRCLGLISYFNQAAAVTAEARMNGYPVAGDTQLKVQLITEANLTTSSANTQAAAPTSQPNSATFAPQPTLHQPVVAPLNHHTLQ